MIFETFGDAANKLADRYSQFVARVKDKDPGAHVSMTRVSIEELELIVTNSNGGRDNYSFTISPFTHEGSLKFEIKCSRVIQ
ncbi:hypothetical protein OFDDKENP_00223 [Aeromonas phage B614]|nr:hypothetical protein OFDDKENP_00223 [Aeromonas phage B614]UYD58300.1 hypothetical protein JNEOFJEA_00221 [Aeromonas phage UP87]UYD58414.1 hypothetical protein IPAKJDPM_00071 [Aeromonas phage avDM14-QBC]UYD58630.1 hypothetical protein HNNIDBEH_00037 [Aeromonas phage avDM10-HWA]UYD59067.1 hypothetical protein OFOPOMKI_00217 [Aeromonas phage avDM7-IJDJ]UYD59879.1 hypothetical protein LEHPIFIF_00106 [Aeromonas phage avDM9-HANS]